MWKITYRGPAYKFVDPATGTVYYVGQSQYVEEEVKDRIVDRTYHLVYRDSWDAELVDEHSAKDDHAITPDGFSEEQLPEGNVFEHVTVHQE